MDDAALPDLSLYAPQHEQGMTEADYVAAQEEYELQQLIASMEQDSDVRSQHYGSDDDDYDSIFMECANTVDQENQYHPRQSSSGFDVFDEMDTMDMDMTDG